MQIVMRDEARRVAFYRNSTMTELLVALYRCGHFCYADQVRKRCCHCNNKGAPDQWCALCLRNSPDWLEKVGKFVVPPFTVTSMMNPGGQS